MDFNAFATDRNDAVVNCAAAINRRNGLSLLVVATTTRMNCSSLTVATVASRGFVIGNFGNSSDKSIRTGWAESWRWMERSADWTSLGIRRATASTSRFSSDLSRRSYKEIMWSMWSSSTMINLNELYFLFTFSPYSPDEGMVEGECSICPFSKSSIAAAVSLVSVSSSNSIPPRSTSTAESADGTSAVEGIYINKHMDGSILFPSNKLIRLIVNFAWYLQSLHHEHLTWLL